MATIPTNDFKLNYVIGGKSQQLINVSYNLNGNIITKSFFTDSGKNEQSFININNSHRIIRQYSNDKTRKIYALFSDSKTGMKQFTSNSITRKKNTYNSIDESLDDIYILSDDNFRDVYSTNINQTDIKYCQVVTRINGLSPETFTSPYIKTTTLGETRHERLESNISSLDWDFKLKSNPLKTYTYIPMEYIRRKLSTAEQLSTEELSVSFDTRVSSYYDYIKSYGENAVDALDALFYPKYNLSVFPINYIYAIPTVLENQYGNNKDYNDYNTGYILAKYFACKNAYDALYSMNFSKENDIRNLNYTRKYFDIGTTSKKLYLKYYDDDIYSSLPNQVLSTSLSADCKDVGIGKNTYTEHTYQKIETFESENIFRSNHNFSEHPTTLYSITVQGLFENIDVDPMASGDIELVKKIKEDIARRIRTIASKFAPATTELLMVKFK